MTKTLPITLSQLLESLPRAPGDNGRELVRKAYAFAAAAHEGQRRASRELFVEHDLAVAHIVSQLQVDAPTVAAALLHDVLLPHTQLDEAAVRKAFGAEVGSLVAALAKLAPYSEGLSTASREQTTEAVRRALLTIIEGDARVILIRLADRLQDLRKAGDLPREERESLALEAREIQAPLANRLGIWQLKWELEDMSFRWLEPEQYRKIASYVAERREERDRWIQRAIQALKRRLNEAGIQSELTGRPKHMYSIYRKMQEKGLNFEQIYDLRALRVIIESDDPSLCYQALGIVHQLWTPEAKAFDDYIAKPKGNGYRSLHTAVLDEQGQYLEVQIRTRAMHSEAERGIAAHWAYKEGGKASAAQYEQINTLRELLTTLREADGASMDSEAFHGELLGERIYVFTPRGDVIDLPAGATPVDFAYAIHTEVGHRCRGTRVNGKMVALDYKLSSGEKVEIITANKGGPSRDWMNESLGYATSTRTRSKVRGWFRQQERDHNIAQGRELVARELRRLGVSDLYSIKDIAEALKYDDLESFLAQVGFGDVQSTQIGGAIAALQQKLRPDDDLGQLIRGQNKAAGRPSIGSTGGLATSLARCCNPIPPEPIVGYITRGRGITIHTQNCRQLSATREPERWIEMDWAAEQRTYPIPIVLRGYRRPGLIDDVANLLKRSHINLLRSKTTTATSVTTIYLEAEVSSLEQLNRLLEQLNDVNNVLEARRERWAD